MSRIGKQPIQVPAGVKVTLDGRKITVAGPQGTLSAEHRPEVQVRWDESEKAITVSIDPKDSDERLVRALWGTTRANIRNMIEGVSKGYEKTLEVVGVGWSAAVQGQQLKLVLGFASPVMVPLPAGLKVSVEKQFIKVQGPDKQQVGQFAAALRSKRKPEPYNGKGIKYSDEVIKRKQGKQFGA
jgi:large subunit ribosomal protein L6